MYILRHNDVDGDPRLRHSIWAYYEDEQKPTKEKLVHTLFQYYDWDKCNRIADSLLASGECEVGDRSGTVFTLEAG